MVKSRLRRVAVGAFGEWRPGARLPAVDNAISIECADTRPAKLRTDRLMPRDNPDCPLHEPADLLHPVAQ